VSTSEHHHLDDVAKALARGTISRSQALKFIGASLAGAGLALIPGVAAAAPPAHAPPGRPGSTPNAGGYAAGGRFGKGGPRENICGNEVIICSSDSDCGGGCTCSCYNPERDFDFCCHS
jgi:hypothetical protein